MEFSTKVNIPVYSFHLTHEDKILLLGSCFTENIGKYLLRNKFETNINPFGIIYNPISIFKSLEFIASNYNYTSEELMHYNELYLSLDHHGVFSNIEKNMTLFKINESTYNAHSHFNSSKYIIITLGTSWVYEFKENNKIVANCHKLPNSFFNKRLLTINDITEAYGKIKEILIDKQVIFTVSPVRHWRDGAVENQRSKSILVEAIHQIIDINPNISYFPAYEIVMDELRDYRFYEKDMLHPNEVAISYIWEKFSSTFFSDTTNQINTKIEKINLLLEHRIKNPNTKAEIDFITKRNKQIDIFKTKYPEIGERL